MLGESRLRPASEMEEHRKKSRQMFGACMYISSGHPTDLEKRLVYYVRDVIDELFRNLGAQDLAWGPSLVILCFYHVETRPILSCRQQKRLDD